MLEILTRITDGEGTMQDLDTIQDIATGMQTGALCALGQLTPGPILSSLRYFRDEFEAHILDKRCPAGVCQELVMARCINACPAEIDIPSWIALVAQGKTAEGLEIHRRKNPFVLTCGRICPAFCETRCRRGDIDEPIAIRQIKRYMADQELDHPWTPEVAEPKGAKVAVVGSGPAGLTAALRLAQMGYAVTVFEKLPVLGGMMAVGIPDYRMPRDILNFEIEGILRAGIEVALEKELGVDFSVDSLFADGFKSVVLALGAHRCRTLGIEGEGKEGVYPGVDFLRDVALGNAPDLTGKRIGVVGGGDVAIDTVRTAWRLGASQVNLIYRRQRAQMPAHPEEIEAAMEEGIQFHLLTNPVRIVGNGSVSGVECLRYELGEFDRSGRRRPMPIDGSEFVLDIDVLIPAIGQEPDLRCLDPDMDACTACGMEIERTSTMVVNRALSTTREGVFAIGDLVVGPATVIQAVAHGNEVARSVDNYIRTGSTEKQAIMPGYEAIEQIYDLDDYTDAVRPELVTIPIDERKGNFGEVELTMPETPVRKECKRCLRCDLEWLEMRKMPIEAKPDRLAVFGGTR
jgi:NADH-quinone oxidoreductase subunit F